MKKLIIVALSMLALTSISYADTRENTKKYIDIVNTSMSELDANTSIQEKATISSLLLKGIDTGYINPSMNNEIKLRDSLVDLVNNIDNYNIEDISLKEKHSNLLYNTNDLIELLNNRIESKSYALDSSNRLIKLKYIIINDSDDVEEINNKIELINKTYKEISKFNKKFNSNKYA